MPGYPFSSHAEVSYSGVPAARRRGSWLIPAEYHTLELTVATARSAWAIESIFHATYAHGHRVRESGATSVRRGTRLSFRSSHRRKRRIVKAAIAASAATALAGVFLASLANAAPTKYVMLNTPSGVGCAIVTI